MVRTQIQLTEDQALTLKTLAARRGVSVAELIRQAMEEYLERERSRRQSLLDRAPHASGRLLRPWTRDELLEEMVSRS